MLVVRHPPDRRKVTREAGHLCDGSWTRAGKPRRLAGPCALLAQLLQKPCLGRLLTGVYEVDVHATGQQAGELALPHSYRHEQTPLPSRVQDEGRAPLCLPKAGLEIGGREHGQGTAGGAHCPLHLVDEIAAWSEVPRLQQDRIAGCLELPGDPFGPEPVHARVADEEVGSTLARLRHAAPSPLRVERPVSTTHRLRQSDHFSSL